MKVLVGVLTAAVLTGCASAEQRMASRADYRDAQVEAIKVQSEQRTARETSEQLAEAAMWQSLAEAVKANPDSASHFAIVMAVAASRGGSDEAEEGPVATIRAEREVTALDYVKVLAGPVLGTATQVGIAALNNDLQKEISRNNRDVQIQDEINEGRIYDVVEAIAESDRAPSVTYTVSDSAVLNTGTFSQDNDVTTTTTTTTTTTSDDDIFVIGVETSAADTLVDETVEEVNSFGIIDEVVETTDTTGVETTDEPFDCSGPLFSPIPPECAGE